MSRRGTGTTVVIVGGLVFVAALALLDWFSLPKLLPSRDPLVIVSHDITLWGFETRLPGILTVIATGTVALAAMSLLSDSVVARIPAVCGSFYLLGQVFPVSGGGYSDYRAGFWVATGAALAMSIGSVLAVVGPASRTGRSHRPS